jgi:hypothetical protein
MIMLEGSDPVDLAQESEKLVVALVFKSCRPEADDDLQNSNLQGTRYC